VRAICLLQLFSMFWAGLFKFAVRHCPRCISTSDVTHTASWSRSATLSFLPSGLPYLIESIIAMYMRTVHLCTNLHRLSAPDDLDDPTAELSHPGFAYIHTAISLWACLFLTD
jgi:hypothetical protein